MLHYKLETTYSSLTMNNVKRTQVNDVMIEGEDFDPKVNNNAHLN